MYYLLNQTNQIIAADDALLTLCGVSHIDELSSKIILGEVTFDPISEDQIIIGNMQTFSVSKTSLSSMLGQLTLVTVQSAEALESENDISKFIIEDIPTDDFRLDDTDESISVLESENDISDFIIEDTAADDFRLDDTAENISVPDSENDISDFIIEDTVTDDLTVDDSVANISAPKLNSDLISIKSDSHDEHNDLFNEGTIEDLLLPAKEDLTVTDDDTSEILIDIAKVSQEIGVSEGDYNRFLDEYIDTALALESDIQSDDNTKRSDAIETLAQLSDVLRLPVIDTIIEKLAAAPKETQKELTGSFYSALSRLTTQKTVQKEPIRDEETLELFDLSIPLEETDTVEEIITDLPLDTEGFGSIDLEGVKPIHFDFQLEEAANDLSLPVALIEEFVHDFIDQAHIETKKMLEAYEKGDLDAIQKIGHLLKGASSNLRINPLSDTLYQIQFCEDPNNLEAYIKEYWGHFLSFEIQINALAQ